MKGNSSGHYYFGDPDVRPKSRRELLRSKCSEHPVEELVLPYDPERVVMKVKCGETFCLFIDQRQHLLMLGWIKETLDDTHHYAHKVMDLSREALHFMDVQSSFNHVLALDRQNRLFGWGSNAFGKLFLEKEKTYVAYP